MLEPRSGVDRSSGIGWDVESSGAGAGVPPGFWFLLGFRVGDWPDVEKDSTGVPVSSRGWRHKVGRGGLDAPPDSSRSLGIVNVR